MLHALKTNIKGKSKFPATIEYTHMTRNSNTTAFFLDFLSGLSVVCTTADRVCILRVV